MNDFKKLLFFLVFSLVFTGISYAEQKSDITTVPKVAEIKSSSVGHGAIPEFAMDDNLETRWGSEPGVDSVWLSITLKNKIILSSVKIIWERASAKRYRIQISEDGEQWKDVEYIKDGKEGERRIITFEPVETKYIRIYGEERTTQWGYSIWELILNPEETFLPAFNPDHSYNNPKLPLEERVEDLLSRMSLGEKVSLLSGESLFETRGNKRLHIPPMIMTDGPHGVGTGSRSTSFPTGTSMAATWDESLIYKVGVALGRETKAQGRHILLGPCVNIHRTPLGGRNFESFSEDPYLASRITVAYVNGVQSQKIGTSAKHYACNNQEWERGTISSEVDERALREIYLPAFKAAVREADTLSVMGAYNKINGVYACENKHLLTDILKTEWGFNGFVVSDWGAVHSTVESLNAGCDLEMPGPGNFFIEEKILQAVKRGDVSKEVIDDKARRILRAIFWLGLFDDPDPECKGALDTPEHRKIAREVAENAIVLLKNKNNTLPLDITKIKSIAVIGPNASVARLGGGGSSAVSPSYSISPLEGLGKKCGDKARVYYVQGCSIPGSLIDVPLEFLTPPDGSVEIHGLKGEYFDNNEFKDKPALTRIDKRVNFEWGGGSPAPGIPNDYFSIRWTGKFTPDKSKGYTLGLISDDGSRLFIDNKLIIDNWSDHAETKVAKSIYLEAGRSYDMRIEYYEAWGGASMKFGMDAPESDKLKQAVELAEKSDVAIIFAGLTNTIEGESVDKETLELPAGQDNLIQEVAKANKNTIVVLINGTPVDMGTWIDKVPAIIEAWYPGQEGGNAIANILFGDVNPSGKLPVTFPKKLSDNPSYGNYPGEAGKVHYKEGIFVGYRHYDKNNIEPRFPFGYGLSYSKFEYSNLIISPKQTKDGNVSVRLDIKNISNREGAEVVQLYINDKQSSLERPLKELKAFEKVRLKPAEKKTLEMKLNKESLSFYYPEKKGWVAEPGEFEILIGSSSRDIRLKDTLTLTD